MPGRLCSREASRLTLTVLISLVAVLGSVTVVTGEARAHWYGFTDEVWYTKVAGANQGCNTFEQSNGDYAVHIAGTGLWVACYTSGGGYAIHSYGFSSATNVSASNQGQVCARARRQSDGSNVFSGCGMNFVQACYDGTYPNCHDIDGTSWWIEVKNNSGVNLRMKNHGVY